MLLGMVLMLPTVYILLQEQRVVLELAIHQHQLLRQFLEVVLVLELVPLITLFCIPMSELDMVLVVQPQVILH
jgi:hypothetical protein